MPHLFAFLSTVCGHRCHQLRYIGWLASPLPSWVGLNKWTEEAWIRPRWSFGDGRKEMILVTLGALAMSMVAEIVFGCTITMDNLPSRATLLEEYFALVGELGTKLKHPASPYLPIQHSKYPVPPWRTPELLLQLCREIVSDMTSTSVDTYWKLGIISRLIRWRPPHIGIIVVELFADIGTRLATIMELGLTVQRYIHVDSALVPRRAARHNIN